MIQTKSDEPFTNYGRDLEGNPYLLDRPEIVIGYWETALGIAAEIYLRLALGVATAVVVFFLMVHEYAGDSEISGFLRNEATDLHWRLLPFLAGAAVAFFPQLFHRFVTRQIEARM